MKKLSREEMKNVIGGDDENLGESGGSDGGCPTACAGTAASGYQGGTCSTYTSPGIGNLPATTGCRCSVSGGSGC